MMSTPTHLAPGNDQFDLLRRSLVCIATEHFTDPNLGHLEDVPKEVRAITDWLTDASLDTRRFTHTHPELASDPTKTQLRDTLEDPQDTRGLRNGDAVVVYVTGHGVIRNGAHWLCLNSTNLDKPTSTALRTADLIGWLAETEVEHLMVLVDLCHAGGAAPDVARFDLDLPESWIALGSVTESQEAKVNGLTEAIRGFLGELGTDAGEKYDHGPYLKVQDFLTGIQERLPGQRLALLSPGLPTLAESPCLPNPRWIKEEEPPVAPARRGVALRPEDLASHWGPRSRGATKDTDPGWLFTGRDALMRQLIATATGDPGILVVAGGAGSGKSAALARLVTLTDPGFRETHAELLTGIPEAVMPPEDCVQAALHAKGVLPDQTLAELCALLKVPPPPTPGILTRHQVLASWSAWLASRAQPVTVVIDAIDESANPGDLIDGILAHLHDGPGGQRLRLIVGVRSPGHEQRGAPALEQDRGTLADRAQRLPGASRVNVDEDPWWQAIDLKTYAASVLDFPPGSPYRAASPGAAETVARQIAEHAGHSFLITRMAAANLAARPDQVNPTDPSWLAAIDEGVVGVFRADLHQELASRHEQLTALHLMRALAFSYGRGLPWNGIWPTVATAVADDPEFYEPGQTPPIYGDNDIAWLLRTRLAGYLITDREDETTVYRMFHNSLANVLRDKWLRLLADSTHS